MKRNLSLAKIKSPKSQKETDQISETEDNIISKIQHLKQLAPVETRKSVIDSLRKIEAKGRHISKDKVFVEDFLSALRPLIDKSTLFDPLN